MCTKEGGTEQQNILTADSYCEKKQKQRTSDSVNFLLISFAVRDAFSRTLMSVREKQRADERQRNPALLILLISAPTLKKKKSNPSPNLTVTPSQTGKPPLNNIMACHPHCNLVQRKQGLIESLKHAPPLTADWACVCLCGWVILIAPFFTRKCLHFFFFVWGQTAAELLFIEPQ